jgi:L-alanine-DL-glutamate epimerase-like enolase superfamily enzyme
VKSQPDYADGFVRLPDAPGIGIELNDEAVRANLRPGFTWS